MDEMQLQLGCGWGARPQNDVANGSWAPFPHPNDGVWLLCQSPAQTLVLSRPPSQNDSLPPWSLLWLHPSESSAASLSSCFHLPESIFPSLPMSHHWLNGHEFEQTLGDSEGRKPGGLQFMGSQRARHNSATAQQFSPVDSGREVARGRSSYYSPGVTRVQLLHLLILVTCPQLSSNLHWALGDISFFESGDCLSSFKLL